MIKNAFILLFFVAALNAETFYVNQKGNGARNGLSEINSWSVSDFNTASNWGTGSGKIDAGDSIILNGIISSSLNILSSGKTGLPITIKWANGASLSSPAWGVDINSAIYISGKNNIIFDGNGGGVIECTANGDLLANKKPSTAIFLTRSNNVEIKNLIIRNIFVHTSGKDNPSTAAAYSTNCIKASECNSLSIHDNVMNNAYMGLYLYTESAFVVSGANIFNNKISSCSTGLIIANGSSGSQINNVLIYGNEIEMGSNWFDPSNNNHIDGIHTWTSAGSSQSGLKVFGNKIYGDPTTHCTGYIFLSDNVQAEVYNNSLTGYKNHPMEGYIQLPVWKGYSANVHDNLIIGLGSTNTGGNGIAFDGAQTGATLTVNSNQIKNCFIALYLPTNSPTYIGDLNNFDGNGNVAFRNSWYQSLSDWQKASGQDKNSNSGIMVNPAVIVPPVVTPSPSNTAINVTVKLVIDPVSNAVLSVSATTQ